MIGLIIAVLVGAAVLGIIIAVMEKGEFPGWGKMVACVLAAVIPTAIVNAILPPEYYLIGLVVGAICAAVAIMYTCGMDMKRAALAAGIYFAVQIAFSTALYFMLK